MSCRGAVDIHRETRRRALESLGEVRALLAWPAEDVEWVAVASVLRATADYIDMQSRDAGRVFKQKEGRS